MSLVTFEIAAVQALLAMQGSISFSPFSEMGITEIIAAEALLQLRGIRKQSSPETLTCSKDNSVCLCSRAPCPINPDRKSKCWYSSYVSGNGRSGDFNEAFYEYSDSGREQFVDDDGGRSPNISRKRRRSCTSESSDQSLSDEFLHALVPSGNNEIRIGDGNANVPKEIYTSIKWDSYTMATRNLLSAVFPRHILATHSLSGKRSPAFPGKAAKEKLDPKLVHDIVKTVVEKCGVPENIVRKAITTKCADESKMLRHRQKHKKKKMMMRSR